MKLLTDATFIAALIAAIAALGTFMWQRRRDVETLRNALFAELRHIRQHYGYAGPELPPLQRKRELEKRLKWSKFGEVSTVKDLGRYAILGAKEMQLLLQISLRIRNTDQLLDMLLEDPAAVTDVDLEELLARMEYVRGAADTLIEHIRQQDSRLSSVPEPE